jgi:carboxyl-terminal processing protease
MTLLPSRAATALLLAATLLGTVAPALADDLPASASTDVHESYRLLTTSYYKHVDAQAVLAGAFAALGSEALKRHVRVTLPDPHNPQTGDLLDTLDATIVSVATAAGMTPTQAAYAAVSGMASALGDKYTQFFTPDDFKQFNDALDPEKISGIGVLVAPDAATGYIQAAYVVPGTPADRAGLQSGDELTSVDGTSTKGMTQEDVSKVLRGKAGTIAHVVAMRGGTQLPPFAIVRAEVTPPTVVYKMLPDRIGYLAIFAFGRETAGQFSVALDRVRKLGARALVLDLRNNGGGYVDSALEISSQFISNRVLLTVEERGSQVTTIDAQAGVVVDLPLTVLVNQYSASASEITAGALQDDGVGTLVGTKTYGKGVMQTVTPLAGGAAIKITTAHYLTPANHDINLRGIEPDVRVDENKNPLFGDPDRDAQLRAALSVLQKKIALAPR